MDKDSQLKAPPKPKKTRSWKQGYYAVRNPHKYIGDSSKVRYMSSWELECHKFFDGNNHVLRWASEEIAIPYIKPTDGKLHKYYPDYWVEYVNSAGEIIQEIIEVKPAEQTRPPRGNAKQSLYEQMTFAVNIAKWAAAEEFCRQRNMKFRIVTSKSIFK